MRNISDIIEAHLKMILEEAKHNHIEIKRSEIADQFSCVPSQINYVINTRFTKERGYLVESKRGGGGYIRIQRAVENDQNVLLDELIDLIEPRVSQAIGEAILSRLIEADYITLREAKLMKAAIDRETLRFKLPYRDDIRARILSAMLTTLKYHEEH